MPAQVAQLGTRARTLLAGFTSGQKTVTAIALLAVLVGGFFFTSWASKPSMVPLFTGLESSDAAAVTEELTGKGTPYQLEDGGRTILVPQQDVYQLRLDMSAAGLPSSGDSGYALLDEQGITTSEFRQRVDYQRALEGELAKTIGAIQDVEAATVHLVMPDENLFSDDNRVPTASVLVKNRPGKSLSSGQVQAIVHLVSSSVEGMDPTRVTVADDKGTVLSAPGEDGQSAAAGDARTAQTRAFEDSLSQEVQNMLAQVVGAGRAVVQVTADLDFDQRETTTERFEPNEGAPKVSESATTETYEGGGALVGGVLGPENVELPEGVADGNTAYTKENVDSQWAVGKVTEHEKNAPGQVERLSVAVLLDTKAMDDVRVAEIEELVTAAAGLDPARGDVVQVTDLPFDESAQQAAAEELEAAAAAERREALFGYIRTGLILLVVAALAVFAIRSMRRDKRSVVELPAELTADIPRPALPGDDVEAELVAAAAPRALEAGDPREAQRLAVREEIGQLVERQPDEVAQLLRGWLADRRS